MFRNQMPRYEILSQDAMATLDAGWRRLISEVGVEFMSEEALRLFREAGQKVVDNTVFFDPEFVLEQVAKAPREFDMQARNPANNVHIGGDAMVFGAVYGPPFVREGAVRRDGTLDDFHRFAKLSQSFAALDSAGGVVCEPNDAPLDSRHLDMIYALQTLTDKIYMGNVVSGENARDTIAMGEILFGGRESIEAKPASISLINCNSPLRWDDRMLDALIEYCKAAQPVVVTPFILMGAMSPVTIPAALVQQITEALSGIALTQLIRPGCPVVFGSFLSNIDMQSGSPTFGTPESGIGLLCTGQIARHFGLPFRTGGGLTSSQVPDAQAGYEALMTLMPTFLAGTNFVMHSAGWLEGGLVAGFREVRHRRTDRGDAAARVHADGDRRGVAGLRRARGGRPRWPLPGCRAHDGALPHLLLPAVPVVVRQLRPLDAQWRQGHRRPRRGHLEEAAGGLHRAAAGRGDQGPASGVRRPPPHGTRRLSLTQPTRRLAPGGQHGGRSNPTPTPRADAITRRPRRTQ
jgi:trimethylamine--corrinoid protein Co-methyltransferase